MAWPDPGAAFREAIHKTGLTPPEAIEPDGRIHRFASNGKPTDDAGWYICHLDGVPAGAFGCWRAGISETWRADVGRTLTPAEEAAHQRKVDAMRRAREAEEARRRAEAAKKARALWAAGSSLREPHPHPYLLKKGVAPVPGLREIHAAKVPEIAGYAPKSRGETLAGRCLVVPVKVGDELSSVELIDEAGRKSFLRDGAVAGGYWAAQVLPDGDSTGLTLLIAEGVATSLSALEATGHLAVAALSSGNLPAVAKAMRQRYPKAKLGILADLGEGRDKAEEAARATRSALVLPDFGEDRPEGATDLNDMHQHRGLEAVAECIATQMAAHAAQEDVQAATADAKAEPDTKTEPGLTDLGNAHRFALNHQRDIRYCWPWAKWLVWNGRFWAHDETGEVHRLAEATVRGMYEEAARSSPERREVLATWAVKCESHERRSKMLASAQAIKGIPIRPGDLDRDPWLLNVRNGTLDLRTGTMRPHAREDLITRGIDVDYDPDAVCPTWERFIAQVFGDDDTLIGFLQKAVGYSLTGKIIEHVLIVLYGLGSNGKTTLIDALHYLLGPYAQHAPTDLLLARRGEHHPTELATLQGARLVTAAETGEGRRLAESLVKQLTGGDPVTARRMREDFWQFRPEFKLWLATNHRPRIVGTDGAIWRRVRLVPFNVTFYEPGSGKTPQQDPKLPARLREEAPGIMAWAIRGCLAWQRDGLGVPAAVRDATEAYRAEMDVLAGFLEECCVFDKRAEASAGDLYRAYTRWCDGSGEHAESQTSFGTRLGERGLTRKKGRLCTVWLGIGLSAAGRVDSVDSVDHFSGLLHEKNSQSYKPEKWSTPSTPSTDGETCPRCAGEGCRWCGGTGRIVNDEPEPAA